jgi:thioredoxin:protein disulfide reductase
LTYQKRGGFSDIMSTTFCAISLNAALILSMVSFSHAAIDVDDAGPLKASAHFLPANDSDRSKVKLVVEIELEKGYHAYSDRFSIQSVQDNFTLTGTTTLAPIVEFYDASSKANKMGISERAKAVADVQLPSDLSLSSGALAVDIRYQACAADHCLFPKTIRVLASTAHLSRGAFELSENPNLLSLAANQPPTGANLSALKGSKGLSQPVSKIQTEFEKNLSAGIIQALLFVFAIGFLTSLTPCIYPMIPITLAVLGARNREQSKLVTFIVSISYILGIAATYSTLGVLAASTGSLFGSALSNIYVVTAIALVFFVMGFGMYGLFEVQVPAAIRNRFGTGQSRGLGGAFLSGIVAGVVASPCVGPVLISILAWIAQTQNKTYGFLFLFTFAMGMGVLFVAIGMSSSLLGKLPKSGPWMNVVKFVFGTTMIAMAMYYISPIYPLWLTHVLLGLSVLSVAFAHGALSIVKAGFSNSKKSSPQANGESSHRLAPSRAAVAMSLIAIVVGSAISVSAALDQMGLSPIGSVAQHITRSARVLFDISSATNQNIAKQNSNQQTPGVQQATPRWKKFSSAELQTAKDSGKAVVIDFSAEWCQACLEMEEKTFPHAQVQTMVDDFTFLKVDATHDSKDLQKILAEYGIQGLPTLIFYNKDGKRCDALTLNGFEDGEPFSQRMRQAQGC